MKAAAKALIGFYEDNTVSLEDARHQATRAPPTSHSGQHFQPLFRHQIQQL